MPSKSEALEERLAALEDRVAESEARVAAFASENKALKNELARSKSPEPREEPMRRSFAQYGQGSVMYDRAGNAVLPPVVEPVPGMREAEIAAEVARATTGGGGGFGGPSPWRT